MQSDIFVDPSLAGPDVLFSTGGVTAEGQEAFDPTLPDIEGAADAGWNITQWSTPAADIFDPETVLRDDPLDADPLLGAALASWHTGTAAGGSSLVVYGGATGVTFRLGASGGTNKDTFLQSTGYASGTVTFDKQITFSADERIVAADAGSGTAIAFNGFTVFFNASDNPSYSASLPQTEMFLQVPLTDYRGEPGSFTTLSAGGSVYQQIYNTSSWTTDASGKTVADESSNYLAFAADDGALHTVSIDLNQALLRMVELMAAENPSMASEYLDLSRWSLGSVYSGVETGGGDGSDAASLTMDIAHPVVTRDDSISVSSDTALSTVQSIDNGTYAESEDATVIQTLAGATDTVRLTNADGAQVFTGNGIDTVLAADTIVATLHGLGSALTVEGDAADTVDPDGSLVVDGTAALAVSGTFNVLSIDSDAAGVTVSATVLARATVALGGVDASVSITGQADATLSGADAGFAAAGGQVVLAADAATVAQNGAGTQMVFLNSYDATVSQADTGTGAGTQIVVGQAAAGGQVSMQGGAGTQVLWTGDADAAVQAGGSGTLQLFIQSGSNSTVSLGGETTAITVMGGAVSVQGGDAGGADRISIDQGSATVQGGAETTIASLDDDGALFITAGSGTQTVFGGAGTLVAMGSHAVDGSQVVVDGGDPGNSATVFGGRTQQTIWTGNASDTIVSSAEAGDASGRIDAFIQGGASSYWGGVESASLDNLGGTLDAFLSGDGAVSILANMAGHTDTVLTGFDSRQDSLLLQNVTDPSLLSIEQTAAGTTLLFGDSQVLLGGVSHATLAQTANGIAVSGWG